MCLIQAILWIQQFHCLLALTAGLETGSAGDGKQRNFGWCWGVMAQGIHSDQKGLFQGQELLLAHPCLSYSSTGHPMQPCHLISILSLWKAIFPDYWWASSGTDKFILGKKKYSLASHSWKATHLTQGFHNSKVRKATHLSDRKIAQYIFWLYYTSPCNLDTALHDSFASVSHL